MSITAAELILYGAASKPTADTGTSGGAIDATMRPVFTQMSATKKLSVNSDGADTRVLAVTGRDATGAIVTENITLNGASEVDSVHTYERIQSVTTTTSGTRTVSVYQDTGLSTLIFTIPPNELGVYMLFQNAFSSSGSELRYEKMFWKNSDGSLTLTSAQVTLTADASGDINIGLATSVSDSGSVANRLSAPGGVSFVGTSTAQNVPGGGNIAAGAAIGVWVLQTLGGSAAAQKTFIFERNFLEIRFEISTVVRGTTGKYQRTRQKTERTMTVNAKFPGQLATTDDFANDRVVRRRRSRSNSGSARGKCLQRRVG